MTYHKNLADYELRLYRYQELVSSELFKQITRSTAEKLAHEKLRQANDTEGALTHAVHIIPV